MTPRQRFGATMHYQRRDRVPICDFGFWDETPLQWHKQGLPRDITASQQLSDYFQMDCYGGTHYIAFGNNLGVSTFVHPKFPVRILEDRGENELIQQDDGITVVRKKYMTSIPQHHAHLLRDRQSWRKHYKPRLDPDGPGRFAGDFPQRVAEWKNCGRPYCLTVPGGSLWGWLRNWMGLEAISYVVYDDPAFFEEMVATMADLCCGVLSKLLATGVQFDNCGFWEDMCYNCGPLLSPALFKKYLSPHYRRITDLLRKHNVEVIWVDCDGKIDSLVPLWLEAGVNCMFPVEVGTWDGDPVRFRREYGKDLLLMGGFDKHILQRSQPEIEKEIHRLLPLVEEGGYIPFCDHRVPPDVTLDNYRFYLETAWKVWCN
jgi:uroporphyrinogen decarboxylase